MGSIKQEQTNNEIVPVITETILMWLITSKVSSDGLGSSTIG